MSAAVVGAALVLTMVLAGTCYRQWRRNQALQAQLQAAATDLEHLQLACSQLARQGSCSNSLPMGRATLQ